VGDEGGSVNCTLQVCQGSKGVVAGLCGRPILFFLFLFFIISALSPALLGSLFGGRFLACSRRVYV